MTAIAERLHEIGRQGVMEAKAVLEGLLPGAVDLPFNAYDKIDALMFDDGPIYGGEREQFALDLGGVLKRPARANASGEQVATVFVEVKAKASGADVLPEYKEFLRRAAVVSLQRAYKDAWFVFYCTVPFGSKSGDELVDGTLLQQCAASWPSVLREASRNLDTRVVLVIATKSFVRMLALWGRNAP